MDDTLWKRFTFFLTNLSLSTVLFTTWFTLLAVIVVVSVSVRLVAPRVIQHLAETYTAAAPQPIPRVALTADALDAAEDRIDYFREAVENEREAESLVLTEEELNGLLQRNDDEPVGYLRLGDGVVTAQLSVLLEEDIPVGLWSAEVKGRYLNGEAILDVRIENGELRLSILSFHVQGHAVPSWMLRRIRERIEVDTLVEDDDTAEFIRRVKTLEALPGRLVLHAQ